MQTVKGIVVYREEGSNGMLSQKVAVLLSTMLLNLGYVLGQFNCLETSLRNIRADWYE